MAKRHLTQRYDSVNSTWPKYVPPLEPSEAITAFRYLFRIGMTLLNAPKDKRTWTKPVKLCGGLQYSYPRSGIMYINPGRGWKHLVHMVSHVTYNRAGNGGHDSRHAGHEKDLILEVLKRGWLEGKLRRQKKPKAVPPPKPKRDLQKERYGRTLKAIAWREAKLKELQRDLRKLNEKIRYYEAEFARKAMSRSASPQPGSRTTDVGISP